MKQPVWRHGAWRYPALAASVAICATMAAWSLTTSEASAHSEVLRATLRDPAGRTVGTVSFRIDHRTWVTAVLRPNPYVAPDAFHGFHVHANNDPANGAGCVADPSQPSTTWFVAVDGHLAVPGQGHGHHDGDMPSPLVAADGTARLSFAMERTEPANLLDRAVVLHAGPDNFGNVPVGTAPDQYLPNSAAATEKTAKTGNAGDRVACGRITLAER